MTTKNKSDALSNELKAFLYQQIQEFERYFMPDSNIGVTVEQDTKSKEFVVTLVMTGGGGMVRSKGQHKDVYQAMVSAKTRLLSDLEQIEHQLIADEDRERGIDQLLQNSPYLH